METASFARVGSLVALLWTACGLSGSFPQLATAAEPGLAYALVVPETTSAEGDIAVAYVKSPANAKAEAPLVIVTDADSGVMPQNGDFTEQNVVVALPTGTRLHTLHDLDDHVFPYFPGLNHADLQALWGPEQEGRRFGLLCYNQRWGSAAVIAVDLGTGVESGKQQNVIEKLNAAVEKELAKQLQNAEDTARYVISYSMISVDDPNGDLGIGDAVSFNLGLGIEVPKSEEDPSFEGSANLTLQRSAKGMLEAKVTGIVVTKAG